MIVSVCQTIPVLSITVGSTTSLAMGLLLRCSLTPHVPVLIGKLRGTRTCEKRSHRMSNHGTTTTQGVIVFCTRYLVLLVLKNGDSLPKKFFVEKKPRGKVGEILIKQSRMGKSMPRLYCNKVYIASTTILVSNVVSFHLHALL